MPLIFIMKDDDKLRSVCELIDDYVLLIINMEMLSQHRCILDNMTFDQPNMRVL